MALVRLGNMILLYVLSVIAVCSSQEAPEIVKLDNGSGVKARQANFEALLGQIGEMGMLLELILSRNQLARHTSQASSLSDRLTADGMGVRLYKSFFHKLNDPVLKSQMLASLENHIDNCFSVSTNQLEKRDKGSQQVRFHSWGGKRTRGAPKVVIRTPFHAWGGKRSGKGV
jgi:hypothetical protein